MSEYRLHEALINDLGSRLVPVRRLLPPWLRTAGWLLAVLSIAGALLMRYGSSGMLQRWSVAPDLAWAEFGATITAITAAWAAFALGVPGRRALWAWLPLPGLMLWLGASGVGCLRTWIVPGMHVASAHEASDCLFFIIGFSIPLSALLIVLLRRACPSRPIATAILIGLASAAASASLLEICHAYDAAATDLVIHAIAIALVIAANAVMGGRLLSKT